jgi:imidazole glycerol-phosphate synthase subunit HisH
MIIIIDYGMGNTGSILNMLKKIGAPSSKISSDMDDIVRADKLILPGVGAFDKAMTNLENAGIKHILHKKVIEDKTPILGICLGIQLFARKSEEGNLPGLSWLDAEVKKFNFGFDNSLKIPHMGWNLIKPKKPSLLLKGLETESRFYFVHSYHIVCKDGSDELSQTLYGYHITSAVEKDNILGVQFHPEKSHKFGMQLFRNFVEYY